MTTPVVVLAPDSYKGSLPALAVARALDQGLQIGWPALEPVIAPMADGGEGTLDCVAAARPGDWQTVSLTGIHGERMTGYWYQTQDGTAVIESAQVLGLPLIEASHCAPALRQRSSYPLGVLMRAALDAGLRRIAIGLGGSACNDAGLGLLTALGARAADSRGQPLLANMDGLLELDTLSLDALDPRVASTDIRVLCDVDNPLLGATGASRVYGPQKGLTDLEIDAVEAAFSRLAERCGDRGAADRPGSGAAGGLGFALAVLDGRLESGAEALIAMTKLHATLGDADLVITGEGRSDSQTLSGKLPLAIARAAAPRPAVLVSGDIAADARSGLRDYFTACHTLVERAGSTAAALAEPERWLREIGTDLGHALPCLLAGRR